MKIAILGYAGQGKSAYDYWNTGENEITICDRAEDIVLPKGAEKRLGSDYLKGLEVFDMIVRTPALHPRDIAEANREHPEVLTKTTSVTNEFLRVCPTRNIIGVTGTKGKGTTSTLIARILEEAGKRVHLGGNIGIPPLDLLNNDIGQDDWVVLELANFQLIDLRHSPPLAVCLMVEPEHLDWHTDISEYIGAKQQLFVHQSPEDIAVFYAKNENSERIVSVSPARKLPYMEEPGAVIDNDWVVIDGQRLCGVDELKLPGRHNWQNVCAAVTAVWQVAQDTAAIRKALTEFSGLPYRIEFRREVDGVRFYNDSFATGPGACMAAMSAVPGKKIMILGGYERGLPLEDLAAAVKDPANQVRKALLIGASADRLAEALEAAGFNEYVHCRAKDMTQVVDEARQLAEPGDAVVLSPAFASFDMFKNFEERGNRFNEAVEAL